MCVYIYKYIHIKPQIHLHSHPCKHSVYKQKKICLQNTVKVNKIRDKEARFSVNINHLVLPISKELSDPLGFEYDPRHNWFTVCLVYDIIFALVITLTKA